MAYAYINMIDAYIYMILNIHRRDTCATYTKYHINYTSIPLLFGTRTVKRITRFLNEFYGIKLECLQHIYPIESYLSS